MNDQPISNPQQYLTQLWNTFTHGKRPVPSIDIHVGDDFYNAYLAQLTQMTRWINSEDDREHDLQLVRSTPRKTPTPTYLAFKTTRLRSTGKPGWDVVISEREV